MPHIPIPPKPTMTTQQKIQTIQSISGNIHNTALQQSIMDAKQVRDIAEQQARMVLDEWLKNNKDLFDSKESKLKIHSIQKIIGMKYDDRLTITGVIEEDKYYEFKLDNDRMNAGYTILLHRRQTDSGHYIMQYESKTLWVTKDEIDMPEKIIICMNTI